MRTRSMKKMPISNLSLILLNDKSPVDLKKNAEYELFNRLESTKSCEMFLNREKEVIKLRGLDVDNYLFSKKPTIQMLLDLYFSFDCDKHLLFSELFLCGTQDNSEFLRLFVREQLSKINVVMNLCQENNSLIQTLSILSTKLNDHNDNIFEKYEPNNLAERLRMCKIVDSGDLLCNEEKLVAKQKRLLLKQTKHLNANSYDKDNISKFALKQIIN